MVKAIKLLACFCLLLLAPALYAQRVFRGIVLSRIDSTAMSFAAVQLKETNESAVTDDKGAFQFTIPGKITVIHLSIAAIGSRDTLTYNYPFDSVQKIYVDVSANMLADVQIGGLSAVDVVRKAVAAIPGNYADSSYFDYSFYRRYQKLNGVYVNLFEARPVVMFRLAKVKNRIDAREAFAVTQLRRSKFIPDIMNATEDNPVDLLIENPVYHLEESSLQPSKFSGYTFRFDTGKTNADYVIHYVCRSSSTDKHGIGDYEQRDLKGEEWEKGELVIDRQSFAIKTIERDAVRYQDYTYKYRFPNNLVINAHHEYLFEFVGGRTRAEYTQHNGKWYVSKLLRQYTNDFYQPLFAAMDDDITDNFEWYSDTISRYTTKEYVDKFYPKLATAIYNYDAAFWSNVDFPFYFAAKAAVYSDLQRRQPLEKQFLEESKVDEYTKLPAAKRKQSK